MTSSKVEAPKTSALTTLISTTSKTESPTPLHALTAQVYHNLQHQHIWTSLKIHDPSEDASLPSLSMPLISGIPPQRMYTHPDEQLYLLQIGLREEDLPSERLWVLPSTQGQTWTLGKLATVFDALPLRTTGTESSTNAGEESKETFDKGKEEKLAKYFEKKREADKENKWGGKRLLLAVVDRLVGGDGTVVYYVVQDGHVKPRQN
ncbi:uncharacterized protein BHQ10_000343 [Talaromyces amestolkiae]|uniref:tRNA-splicing endonuclease subunit Sen15 domain-containing protein n=1 Tax=Talaromyces amestolkiae TaxID=1196081 RepID=A0A364KLC3_TALAM|nr:uncharacterized protein BHQ10_000343 [Talaromyces amestolkiae]RAO64331.1 hypothetical protein BHQ10_000343 [Talaromyces amestolkiae]